jgi:hypothetical protein
MNLSSDDIVLASSTSKLNEVKLVKDQSNGMFSIIVKIIASNIPGVWGCSNRKDAEEKYALFVKHIDQDDMWSRVTRDSGQNAVYRMRV